MTEDPLHIAELYDEIAVLRDSNEELNKQRLVQGEEIGRVKELHRQYRKMLERAYVVLSFYADPETYHAVSFMFDSPGGGWKEDFSDDHEHWQYDRAMPGKQARKMILELSEKVNDKIFEDK